MASVDRSLSGLAKRLQSQIQSLGVVPLHHVAHRLLAAMLYSLGVDRTDRPSKLIGV
jgi:hypothetical protein